MRMSERVVFIILIILSLIGYILTSPISISAEDENTIKGVEIEGKRGSFFLSPDTANINLQVLPGSISATNNPQAGQISPIADYLATQTGDIIIEGKGLPTDVLCDQHNDQHTCTIDMDCGWCISSATAYCVEGSFGGPCNASVDCPVYITFQQPGIGSNDCGTNKRACIDEENDDDVFHNFGDTPDVPVAGKYVDPIVRAVMDEQNLSQTEAKKRKKSSDHPNGVTYEQAIARIRETQNKKNLILDQSKLPSPCGVPGNSEAMCQEWISQHCGGDHPANDPACEMSMTMKKK